MFPVGLGPELSLWIPKQPQKKSAMAPFRQPDLGGSSWRGDPPNGSPQGPHRDPSRNRRNPRGLYFSPCHLKHHHAPHWFHGVGVNNSTAKQILTLADIKSCFSLQPYITHLPDFCPIALHLCEGLLPTRAFSQHGPYNLRSSCSRPSFHL